MNEVNYIAVGKYKGEWDFGVNGSVCELSYEEVSKLREMIIVAIGTMEDMWRRAQDKKHPTEQALPKEEK